MTDHNGADDVDRATGVTLHDDEEMAKLCIVAACDHDPRLFATIARLNGLQGHVSLSFLYRTIELALRTQLEDQYDE